MGWRESERKEKRINSINFRSYVMVVPVDDLQYKPEIELYIDTALRKEARKRAREKERKSVFKEDERRPPTEKRERLKRKRKKIQENESIFSHFFFVQVLFVRSKQKRKLI